MSANLMLMQDDTLYAKYFAEDLEKRILDAGNREFSKARKLWNNLGLKVTVTREDMINAVVEKLSENLTKGLVQLTIEEIMIRKECKDALREKKNQTIVMGLSKNLPPFKVYAEFIIESGFVELKKFRFDFKTEPNVEIEDINVTIQENKVKSVSFGSFKTSLTLSLLNGEQTVSIATIEKSLSLPVVHFGHQKEWDNISLEAAQEHNFMKAELILPRRNIEIEEGENIFGRSDFAGDLSIEELGYISNTSGGKYHFMIIRQGEIFYIKDEHSLNGTEVNGGEIKGRGRIKLKDDDKITLAGNDNFIMTFRMSDV